ncbi:MAG: NAD(P)-dependent oxidoreductase [Bowdeniella nasicola]|nr:NAD(P)-dependent oxidoreductase [Bowdeniella nasicola]
MRVVITGVGGLVGRHLAAHLNPSHDVVGLSRQADVTVPNVTMAGPGYAPDHLRRVFATADAVIHLAARRGSTEPTAAFLPDVALTEIVTSAARDAGVARFVLASSISVYDPSLDLPWHEECVGVPRNAYGIAKLAAEHVALHHARASAARHGRPFEVVVLRLAHVYGPDEDSPHAIPTMLSHAAQGRPLMACPPSERRRDLVYVADVARACALALEQTVPTGVYNVGSGAAASTYEVANVIACAAGLEKPTVVPAWSESAVPSLLDLTRAREALGYTPAYNLAAGVRAALAFRWEHP